MTAQEKGMTDVADRLRHYIAEADMLKQSNIVVFVNHLDEAATALEAMQAELDANRVKDKTLLSYAQDAMDLRTQLAQVTRERDLHRASLNEVCRERDRMRKALTKLIRIGHYECEDPWYSCPLANKPRDAYTGEPYCDCGADRVNTVIAAALKEST